MIPAAKDIKPAVNGVSDFFGWNLYRWMRNADNHAYYHQIWLAPENNVDRCYVEKDSLFIGRMSDDGWFSGRRIIDVTVNGKPKHSWAYSAGFGTKNWTNITEEFWERYLRIGVCAIHGDHAHKWRTNGGLRTCQYCGKTERKTFITKTITREAWA